MWALALAALGAVFLGAQGRGQMVEWPHYGGDAGHGKYSVAADITTANAGDLELAWTWQTADRPMPGFNVRPGGFETTPIMIDDVLYASTSFHQVAALNPETGQQLWLFDPRTYEEGPPLSGTGLNSRGVAFWRGDNGEARIFIAGRQRLFAIDARSGKPVATFAGGGAAALNENLGRDVPRLHTQVTSPPVVYRNLVIIGTGVPDRLQYRGDPPGTVQAFDVRTGARVWVFFTIPQSPADTGADSWGNESWRIAGHANVWAPMSLDEARGLLFLPTSTPSGDYWGGWRPGANLFAESLVCLDALTGQRRWHFQAIHHGLWDYDFASAPTLATSTAGGQSVDVVAQVSKQGFTYVFDRVTGRPIWPIEERPVPRSDVPGEASWPTQPFPSKPPAFESQGVTLDDAFDATPQLKERALAELKKYRLGPLYTPPSMQGTVVLPGVIGGANWGGGAFDPATGRLFVKTSRQPAIFKIEKFDISTQAKDRLDEVDADYVNRSQPTSIQGVPILKPPYGNLVAIDLNRGEIAWKVPFGDMPQLRSNPALKDVALPPRLGAAGAAGVIVTRSGLILGGGNDTALNAFDAKDGRELWRHVLPREAGGTPVTYLDANGKQVVVIATGRGEDTALIAFRLP
jgi:quinoprotein glucose dehydrogenase